MEAIGSSRIYPHQARTFVQAITDLIMIMQVSAVPPWRHHILLVLWRCYGAHGQSCATTFLAVGQSWMTPLTLSPISSVAAQALQIMSPDGGASMFLPRSGQRHRPILRARRLVFCQWYSVRTSTA